MSSSSLSVVSEKKGLVEVRNGHFWITGDPHLLFRAERAILNAKMEGNAVLIPVTDETSHDVMWFASRFPIRFADQGAARIGSASFIKTGKLASTILDPNYQAKRVKFRKGLKPRAYQQVAADLWLTMGGLLVGDELGLGKTITAAAGLADPRTRPAIVLCQANLCQQWRDALREFMPDVRAHIIRERMFYEMPTMHRCKRCGIWHEYSKRGLPRCDCGGGCEPSGLQPDVLICSYSKLDAWVSNFIRIAKSLVVDECQELRNSESKKSMAAAAIGRSVAYRIGLSGTPIVNHGGEIWNIYSVLYPGKLGDKQTFRKTWCEDTRYTGREPALRDPEAFGAYLRDQGVFIRRTRAEVGRELPEHTRIVHPVDSDPEAFDSIKGRAAELAQIIMEGSKVKGDVMAAHREFDAILRQATGIAKAPYVAGFVDLLLEQGTSLILFGFHRAVYDIWLDLLGKHEPIMYTGTETAQQKHRNKQRFCNGESKLLICSLASTAGLDGLQFSGCHTGVFGELDWTEAKLKQGIGRYHRDGQKDPCMTYFLVSEFGADPFMAEVIQKKKAQSDALLRNKEEGTALMAEEAGNHIRDLAARFLMQMRKAESKKSS